MVREKTFNLAVEATSNHNDGWVRRGMRGKLKAMLKALVSKNTESRPLTESEMEEIIYVRQILGES